MRVIIYKCDFVYTPIESTGSHTVIISIQMLLICQPKVFCGIDSCASVCACVVRYIQLIFKMQYQCIEQCYSQWI